MNLKEELAKLVELQKIDARIYELIKERDVQKPEQLRALREDFESKKGALTAAEERVKAVQLKKKDRELDLQAKEDDITKAQGQLYQLKTNKEYQAKLAEISVLKADVSVLEEDVLKLLEAVEKAEAEVKEAREVLARQEANFKEKESAINNRLKEIDIEINQLQDRRRRHAREVEPKILAVYESKLKTRSGLAVVPVEGRSCGACHMQLTHQKVNEQKMYKDLVFCQSCFRILYIPEDIGQL